MELIKDLDIYDLFRTVYADDSTSKSRRAGDFKRRHRSFKGNGYSDMQEYVNLPEVRKALNIPETIQKFIDCNDEMYDTYQVFREGSIWIYNMLLKYGTTYRLLHYSGDTDGAVATRGTR